MKNTYDLYGLKSGNLESAREKIEQALAIQFRQRENDSIGKYYHWGKFYEEEIEIQNNFSEYEQDWRASEYKQAVILIYVNNPKDPDELRQKLTTAIPEIIFLEREEIEEK